MNCNTVAEKITDIVTGALRSDELADCERHIAWCRDCSDAVRGAEALASLDRRDVEGPPADLFAAINAHLPESAGRHHNRRRFWMGTGFGGAVAASLFALALAIGWVDAPERPSAFGTFTVALDEPRNMNVAIETERALANATITVILSGNIELEGYAGQRELTWNANLEAGVNRLTLPVRAVDPAGGRMVVRLRHPESEQVFVVDVNADA